jgi:uncharacterized membrane protein
VAANGLAMPATFFGIHTTPAAMCGAGIVVFLIGMLAAKRRFADARGLERILALTSVCVAVPLAVFGALHLFGPRVVSSLVPAYMPWRTFWVYGVGCALIAASVSIAAGIGVRWSGVLFGVMMFLFVGMIHLPGALARPDRIIWTIVFREMSFGGAGWLLAGTAIDTGRGPGAKRLIAVGGVFVTAAMIVFGVEHFLHPTGLPGVPLVKQMPAWISGRVLIDYLTGAALLVGAGSALLARNTRTVAACVGGWLLLMVLVIYAPLLIAALSDSTLGVQLEGVNYFADTLLFAGAILALGRAAPVDRPKGIPFSSPI